MYLKYYSHRSQIICGAKFWLLYEIGNLKKRLTSSPNSLYVQENIVIEDDFEESAVKISVHLSMKYLQPRGRALSAERKKERKKERFFHKTKTYPHILQQT